MVEPKGSPKRDVVLMRLNEPLGPVRPWVGWPDGRTWPQQGDGLGEPMVVPTWYIEVQTESKTIVQADAAADILARRHPATVFVAARLCPAVMKQPSYPCNLVFPDWFPEVDPIRATGRPRETAFPGSHAVLRRLDVVSAGRRQTYYLQVGSPLKSVVESKLAARREALSDPGSVFLAAKMSRPVVAVDVAYRSIANPDLWQRQKPESESKGWSGGSLLFWSSSAIWN